MQNNFEDELRGEEEAAIDAKQQIGKYFRRYGESGHKDAWKHQLIFASRIMHTIAKCELKHLDIYCEIITNIFGDSLRPECAPKYWSSYVSSLRYFHYILVTKKHYGTASKIYHFISDLNNSNKLQTEDVCVTLINTYCNHLYLQNSHLQIDRQKALDELSHVIENLTYLFEEMLEKNKTLNLQYPDILAKSLQWLFPNFSMVKIQQFLNNATNDKISTMFGALFKLNAQQRIPLPAIEDIHRKAQHIVETLNTYIMFDVIDTFQIQFCVLLMKYCRLDTHLQSDMAIAEVFLQLYEYLRLICAQKRSADFDCLITKYCERFKELFEIYSKSTMNLCWFKDLLVFLNTLHIQMQNPTVFACFWKQMTTMSSYHAILTLLLETMKLAPCITPETKLNTFSCCSSVRKHIIFSSANIALSIFVLYCQNVKNEPKEESNTQIITAIQDVNQSVDLYNEMLHKPLILIISHAFKVIDKMDCIDHTSQDLKLLLTRFKQAALSACTSRQAKTCIKLCELFLKINSKIADIEWPLLLRRVYKSAAQCLDQNPLLIREIQMCYVASLLQLSNELDVNQIRGQISLYYRDAYKDEQQTNQQKADALPTQPPPPHDHCLIHMLQHSTNTLRPHLKSSRKKLLHWFEVQHAVKYHKSNTNLMQSLIQSSQSYYDLIITTRATKLLTSDVPKFISIYKYLRSKTPGISRLEHLTYGHCCTKVLQEYQNHRSQNALLDSKYFVEDQLEHLLMNKEMETMTICHELQYVKLAYDGFMAFEKFYDKFDEEQISSDDAIIDWELIIDDLTILAQFLQFSSYMEYASHVWMLHYKISQLIGDSFSALRGLAFFCEYSAFYEEHQMSIDQLEKEIQLHLSNITNALTNLANLHRRKQNFVLLAALQIAYFYVRCSKYTFGQMLLQFVEEKHYELVDRRGNYDIIMATLDIIRYRILWKHYEFGGGETTTSNNSKAENLLLNQCLMGEIEQTMERLRDFVFVTGDGMAYNMLLTCLAQDFAECSANRLYENLLSSLFVAACKCSLQYGFALRMAQVMSTWIWVNLQMEYVDAAQTKFKIIEYIMGIKSLNEVSESSTKATSYVKSSCMQSEMGNDALLIGLNQNNGIEATRRLAQVQLSPIKTGKLQLRPETQKTDLKKYFKFKIDTKTLPQNEILEWMYFTIGCLNARLYFLVEDYVQLESFYEKGSLWLETRQNNFNKRYFRNVQLMAVQHYANFLRANNQPEKAIQCLKYGLELCESMKLDLDVVYRVNFRLQLLVAQQELDRSRTNKHLNGKIKRALKFNLSPEQEKYQCEKLNRALQLTMASSKRQNPATVVVVNSSGTKSTRKLKHPASNHSSSSSPETKSKIKAKLKFNICEDAIEIEDSDDNHHDELKDTKTKDKSELKSAKKIKSLKSSSEHYTPKISRKSSKISGKTIVEISPKLNDNHRYIDTVDLLDTPTPVPTNISASSSSSSSMENLKTKENHPPTDTDLVAKLESLELIDKPKKTKTTVRKRKSPVAKKMPVSAPIIILEDSPSIKTVENGVVSKSRSRPRNKNLTESKESEPTTRPPPTRRRRNIIKENNENDELNPHNLLSQTPSLSSTGSSGTSTTSTLLATSSTISTRRRQKI